MEHKVLPPEVFRTCEKIESVLNSKNLRNDLCLRLKEFDENNCGFISNTKFFNVVFTQLGETFGINEDEAQEVVNYFVKNDKRVDYMEFINKVDFLNYSINFTNNLKCSECLENDVNILSSMEMKILNLIFTKIAYLLKFCDGVSRLEPIFQDNEIRERNNGSMSISLFRKILYFAGITLGDKEFDILIKRFSKLSFTINYVAFLAEVKKFEKWIEENEDFIKSHNLDSISNKIIKVTEISKTFRPEIGNFDVAEKFGITKCGHPCLKTKNITQNPSVCQTILKVKKFVKDRRINVSQFFRGFDVFNIGSITKIQFHRGLESMGFSNIEDSPLTLEELDVLFKAYSDKKNCEKIHWKNFCFDVDEEENCCQLPIDILNKPELKFCEVETLATTEIAQKTMMKIRKVIKSYKIAIEYYFKGFDKMNRNHVSSMQMRRVLSSNSILLSEMEYRSLIERYEDDIGFNYKKFLQELDEICYCQGQKSQQKILICPKKPKPISVVDLLAKLRNEMMRKQIKIDQFMKGANIKNGKVNMEKFKSSFAMAGIILNENELKILCKSFQDSTEPDLIDYKFFDDIFNMTIATGKVAKNPKINLQKLFPNNEEDNKNFLNDQERCKMSETLQKILNALNINLSSFEDIFKDYSGHSNIITRYSLEKVMKNVNVLDVLTSDDLDLIFKYFSLPVALKHRKFNFKNFIEVLSKLKQMMSS